MTPFSLSFLCGLEIDVVVSFLSSISEDCIAGRFGDKTPT